jgi:hypothetical protein
MHPVRELRIHIDNAIRVELEVGREAWRPPTIDEAYDGSAASRHRDVLVSLRVRLKHEIGDGDPRCNYVRHTRLGEQVEAANGHQVGQRRESEVAVSRLVQSDRAGAGRTQRRGSSILDARPPVAASSVLQTKRTAPPAPNNPKVKHSRDEAGRGVEAVVEAIGRRISAHLSTRRPEPVRQQLDACDFPALGVDPFPDDESVQQSCRSARNYTRRSGCHPSTPAFAFTPETFPNEYRSRVRWSFRLATAISRPNARPCCIFLR